MIFNAFKKGQSMKHHEMKNNADNQRLQVFKYCILSGVWTLVVMLLVYFAHSNSLFKIFGGDLTVLRMDLYHQYGPLVAEVYDRITTGASLTYSFTSGLGGGFLGNFFNYCASPFTYVILLFGHKNMPEAIAVIILLKAILSSVSFSYFINKITKKTSVFSIAFALMYTFSGYFVAFSWNIMWLDAMSVFPLVMLGISRIIDEKRPILYISALAYTMITNYYMAYMVCLLSVVWFLFYYFSNYSFLALLRSKEEKTEPNNASPYGEGLIVKEILPNADVQQETDAAPESFTKWISSDDVLEKVEPSEHESPKPNPIRVEKGFSIRNSRFFASGFTFAFASILSFMLAAFALLPVIYTLQSSSATSSTAPEKASYYFNIFTFLANHLPSVETTIRSSGNNVIPNVYCGLMTVMLLPFFFLSSKISGKKKVCAFLVLFLFYFSFNLNKLNYIWHGLHFPNDLPYRWSFAYSFFLLYLAYQALLRLEEFSRKYFVLTGFGVFAFIALISKLGVTNVTTYSLILSAVMTVVYVVAAGLMTSPRYQHKTVAGILVFLVIVELLFGNTPRYVMAQSKKDYTGDYDQFQEIRSDAEKEEDQLFYRTELSRLRARMDACWYGYPGVSTFSSMAYERTSNVMKSLGLFGNNINSYTYYPQTPVFNSFFSLKYVYDNRDLLKNDNDFYEKVASNQTYTAYRYQKFLPVAFAVDSDIENWSTGSTNPFELQNDLVNRSTGVEDVFEKVRATDYKQTNLGTMELFTINSASYFYAAKTTSANAASLDVVTNVQEDGQYYIHAGSSGISDLNVVAGSKSEQRFSYRYTSSGISAFVLDLGKLKKGDTITVTYTLTESNSGANLYYSCVKLNEDRFEEAYQKIQNNGLLNLDKFKESHFSGTMNVNNENAVVFTSIPYDESWEIYVDGRRLSYDHTNAQPTKFLGMTLQPDRSEGEIFAVGNAFIGFRVDKGDHTIQFRYVPKGLAIGLEISFAAILIAVLLLVFKFVIKAPVAKKKGKNIGFFLEPDKNFATEQTPEDHADQTDTPSDLTTVQQIINQTPLEEVPTPAELQADADLQKDSAANDETTDPES